MADAITPLAYEATPPPPPPPAATAIDDPPRALFLVAAAVAVAEAVYIRGGNYPPAAVAFVALALLCTAVAVLARSMAAFRAVDGRAAGIVIGAALAVQVGLLFARPPKPI